MATSKKKSSKKHQTFSFKSHHIAVAALFVFVFSIAGSLYLRFIHAATPTTYSPGGTNSVYTFPGSNYGSLEWTLVPVQDTQINPPGADLTHYYFYEFYLENSNNSIGLGYAGLQNNGFINNRFRGHDINYSIWGSDAEDAPADTLTTQNTECHCMQQMLPYPWQDGHQYRFQIKQGPHVADPLGKWWGLWVTDLSTSVTTYVGEQRVAATINGKPSTSFSGNTVFVAEDSHWTETINGPGASSCSQFETSSMAFLNPTANGSIKPKSFINVTSTGRVSTGSNGFKTLDCAATINDDGNMNVQANLGWHSATQYMYHVGDVTYGQNGDIPVPGNYLGDRKAEIAVYRPLNGTWYVHGQPPIAYGLPTDIPVPADYNGDGKLDIAVYRPSTAIWYVRGQYKLLHGGGDGIPVPGDYDGKGKAMPGLFYPENGNWYIHGQTTVAYGGKGDIAVPADYNGDGKTDIAVFRPSNGTWYIRGIGTFKWGTKGDIPVPADYNGDHKADLAVFRPSNGKWYIYHVGDYQWGTLGDIPIPADYSGDGRADISVRRIVGQKFYPGMGYTNGVLGGAGY